MKKIILALMLVISVTVNAQYDWTLSNSGYYTSRSILEMAEAPNGDIYLAACHLSGWNAQLTPSLFKSTDNGATWQVINLGNSLGIGKPTSIIFSGTTLLMAGSNPAGTDHFIYKSNDYGLTWTLSNVGVPNDYKFADFAKTPNGNVYLASYTSSPSGYTHSPKLLSTTNAGNSWNIINTTGLYNSIKPQCMIFDKNGKGYMWASNLQFSEYYTSTNNGLTWVQINAGISQSTTMMDFALGNGNEVYAVCSEYNSSTGVTWPKLMRTTSAGASWTTLSGVADISGMEYSSTLVNAGGNFLWGGFSAGSSGENFIFKSILPKKPTVVTHEATNVGDVFATCGLDLTDDGGVANNIHGLCWNTTPNPSVTTSQTISTGSGVGTFTLDITTLNPVTTYYMRAFATNSVGTAYGNQVTFTTGVFSGIPTLSSNTKVSVLPVPASDIIHITINESTDTMNYIIYSIDGKALLTLQLQHGDNSADISSLAKGVYFLGVKNGEKIKIVKE
jgi:hypothetical protein